MLPSRVAETRRFPSDGVTGQASLPPAKPGKQRLSHEHNQGNREKRIGLEDKRHRRLSGAGQAKT
jgi:hypothetical protein